MRSSCFHKPPPQGGLLPLRAFRAPDPLYALKPELPHEQAVVETARLVQGGLYEDFVYGVLVAAIVVARVDPDRYRAPRGVRFSERLFRFHFRFKLCIIAAIARAETPSGALPPPSRAVPSGHALEFLAGPQAAQPQHSEQDRHELPRVQFRSAGKIVARKKSDPHQDWLGDVVPPQRGAANPADGRAPPPAR